MNVVIKIFGNVCKVRQIFGILGRAVDVLNAMLANHSLTLNVDKLDAVVRYR